MVSEFFSRNRDLNYTFSLHVDYDLEICQILVLIEFIRLIRLELD